MLGVWVCGNLTLPYKKTFFTKNMLCVRMAEKAVPLLARLGAVTSVCGQLVQSKAAASDVLPGWEGLR